MKRSFFILLLLMSSFFVFSQQKKPLYPGVYEDWKILSNARFSPDGRFISYEVNPQKGDGILVVRNNKKEQNDSIDRGYSAKFSFDSRYLVGMVKAPYDSIRSARKADKEEEQLPQDSLFIMDLKNGKIEMIPDVRNYKLSEEKNNLLVYHHAFKETDDKNGKKKNNDKDENGENKLRKKYKLADLVVYDPEEGNSQRFENVASWSLSKNGNLVAFHQLSSDTSLSSVVYAISTGDNVLEICHEGKGIAENLSCDDSGKKLAFLFSEDTSRIAGMELHYWEIGKEISEIVIDSAGKGLPGEMMVNRHGKVYFSGNSERLFFGTSKMIEKEPEDTLLEEEKASVDVWSWEDQILQPMQKIQLENEKKRSYLAYYDLNRKMPVQLADSIVRTVKTMHEGNGNIMLGLADEHYGKLLSWEGLRYNDVYYIDPASGEKKLLQRKLASDAILSPFGKYLFYYSMQDSAWISVEIPGGEKHNLTGKINVNYYDELHDIPRLPGSYGYAGFTENDEYVLIYDRYDIWKIDPSGKAEPENLTQGRGRENKIQLRYKKLDPEAYFIDLEEALYLTAFDTESMDDGYYVFEKGNLKRLMLSPHDYADLMKAKEKDIFAYRKGNFKEYNNLYISGSDDLKTAEKVSDANPQQSNFLWGDVRQVSWISFNGDRLKGLLYTPENLDENKKYPLLVYFYERSSHELHEHVIPRPSRSIINPSYCTSNGYVVFVPDIVYREGYPGQSAYDAVISGTQSMVESYDFIDSDRMGLQGQSWGGYQIAWLVTRTNMFAAAMAGAPVSNMTSAYGGIRWGTGMSRMFQYENTQSRIGVSLWDELDLYLENSPIFGVNRVETPLLIMHNDDDGAVPWYQGIELFVAMRRLDKPVWMLTYNEEAHNLTRWPNRMDLDIRMMQFFDHFLKGEKMPGWMEKGVPATEKNKITGEELLK